MADGRSGMSRAGLNPRTLRAFHATAYSAGHAAARIGRRCPALDRVLPPCGGAFITAWNPGARRAPSACNRRADRALQGWLSRLPHLAGTGQGRGWREEHWLVAADFRRVAVLARRFRQAAIVTLRRGQPARLLVLPPQAPPSTPGLSPSRARWSV